MWFFFYFLRKHVKSITGQDREDGERQSFSDHVYENLMF